MRLVTPAAPSFKGPISSRPTHTASAPSASALNTSMPLSIPQSTKTGICPSTAFTISGAEEAKPAGILLHDVDVTAGNENGTIVLFGFVDLDKLDAETFKLITAEVKTALSGKVTFLTGSGKKRTE